MAKSSSWSKVKSSGSKFAKNANAPVHRSSRNSQKGMGAKGKGKK